MTADSSVEIRTRTDTQGRILEVASEPCEQCGCPFDYSVEEPGVIWEAGPAIEDECLDPMCECHVMPAMGLAVRLHFRPPEHYARPA